MAGRGWFERLTNPGGLYNAGNVIGFSTGLLAAVSSAALVGSGAGPLDAAADFLMGSPAALAMTVATAIFFWGGLVYSKAWANGAPPDQRLNRHGDIYSGAGAICLAAGLSLLGDPLLAASAGLLHALGKFGSALAGSETIAWRGKTLSVSSLCKDLVFLSRLPALAAALMGLSADVLSLSFVACTVVWAVADWKLLAPETFWMRLLPVRQGA